MANSMNVEKAREALAQAEAAAAEQARKVAELEAKRNAELAEKIATWARGVVDRYPAASDAARSQTTRHELAFYDAVEHGDIATMRDAWLAWGGAAQTEYLITSEFLNAASRLEMRTYNDVSLPTPRRGKFIDNFSEAVSMALGRTFASQSAQRQDAYHERLQAVIRGEVG